MSEPYQVTISGLIRKRAETIIEIEKLRDQVADLTNTLRSLDRVLLSLGHKEEPPINVRGKRILLFERKECQRFILNTLRESKEPLSSRQIANEMAIAEGKDPTDRRLMVDLVRRISKAVSLLREKGVARRIADVTGRYTYHLAGPDPE